MQYLGVDDNCTAKVNSLEYREDGFLKQIIMHAEYSGCTPGVKARASLFYDNPEHSEVARYEGTIDSHGHMWTPEIEHNCTAQDPPVYGELFSPEGRSLFKSKSVLCK